MAAVVQNKQNIREDTIFVSFHNNEKLLKILKGAVTFIKLSFSGYGYCLHKIVACNATFSKTYSQACCVCEELREDTYPVGFGISSIFDYGFQVLEEYIDNSLEDLPSGKGAKLALSRLLHFLTEDLKDAEAALTNTATGISETDWTLRLTHHLLSKLTVSPSYKLDHVLFQGSSSVLKCSCDCLERISGSYGDNSIGVRGGWHGHIGVMMGDAPVTVVVGLPESDSPIQGPASSKEILVSCREQIRAQAVVCSFWQQKVHPELNSFLIPSIAISKEQIGFCFYDCENDIMLETPLFELVSDKFLYIPSVIVLWLALNFKFLCSGLPEEIKSTGFKADFFKVPGLNVERYKQDVVSPCDFFEEKWVHLRKIKQLRRK